MPPPGLRRQSRRSERTISERDVTDSAAPAIELRGIDKWFGAVHANRDISLVVRSGSIHGIVGENGAGKSTLMGILYGYYQPDRGEILVRGEPTVIRSSQDSLAAGIGMVHQHFMHSRCSRTWCSASKAASGSAPG